MTTKEMINEKFGRDMFSNNPVLIPSSVVLPKDKVQSKKEVLNQNSQELVKVELPELKTVEDAKKLFAQQQALTDSGATGLPLKSMTFQMV